MSEELPPLPVPAVNWTQPLLLKDGGAVSAAVYYRAEQMRAYGAECARLAIEKERLRQSDLLKKCAEMASWHLGDFDECGTLAREVYAAIKGES